MLRFRRGEQDAFTELVDRNIGTVHALVYRFLREPSMVDDITQEVFLRVVRNAHRYRPTAKFSTWLYRITANLCFNVMRSRKKHRTLSLEPHLEGQSRRELPDQASPRPHDRLAGEELQRHVAEAVRSLPDNQRIAILLNKYEDKSYQEIAEVLGTTTMAVKSLLSRARANLAERLEKHIRLE